VDVHPLEPPPVPHGPLDGVGVIVTRPQRQAAGLARTLASVGATPLIWPAIVILPPQDRTQLERAHAALASYDVAVFVSANAAEYGVPDASQWPKTLRVFAPGPGTAEALAAVGVAGVRIPLTTFDTEGLLALPELQHVDGARVVIFRGQGGRELLGSTLAERGAHVDYVACYRRTAPTSGAEGLLEALREGRAHAITLSSSEGIDNVLRAVGIEGRALLERIPAFVPHPRIADHARAAGLSAITTAAGGDAGLVAGLLEWFAAHPVSTRPVSKG
jgi:uroporphyrinogen-III synthase